MVVNELTITGGMPLPNGFQIPASGVEAEDADVRAGIDEALEVFWNGFDVGRNKGDRAGYQLIGRTDGGRRLKLIVYEKRERLIPVMSTSPNTARLQRFLRRADH